MRQQPTRSVAALAIALALAAPASATVLVPADLGTLARSAVAIVHGRVVDVRPEWVDGRRRIETVVTLDVEDSLKGGLSGTITFKVPGGVMGRYRSVLVGAPSFGRGDEVVLFLGARPPALPYLLGLGQGVFRVLRDPRTGRTAVSPPVLVAEPDAVIVQRGDRSRQTVPLEEFSATVRSVLTPARAAGRRGPVRPPPAAGDAAPQPAGARVPPAIKGIR
jgi:hypothetical protein